MATFLILFWGYFGNEVLIHYESQIPSQLVMGTQNKIIVNHAKRLPSVGANFETYSRILSTIGRTHVHEGTRKIILAAYESLAKSHPEITFVYGETGWKNGGYFWPHRTHRNGQCVDFMVPVFDSANIENTKMSLSPFNLYGYNLRFDAKGQHQQYQINFKAIVDHVYALKQACQQQGAKIKVVILDPQLLALLKKTSNFHLIKDVHFMKTKAWFPHDSHYHIEFSLPVH